MRLLTRNSRMSIALLALAALAVCLHTTATSADDPTSIAGAGQGNWTTPEVGSTVDYSRTAAPRYMLQEAPRPSSVPATTYYGAHALPSTPAALPGSTRSTSAWATGSFTAVPAAEVTEVAPETYAAWPTDVTTDPAPVVTAPCDPCAPAPVAAPIAVAGSRGVRTPINPTGAYTGCGLPCMQGISEWHVRAILGRALFAGDDPANDCTFAGVDIGRTFCGCWGLDLYYRYNSGTFDRVGFTNAAGDIINRDGGHFHHVGLKVTMERGFNRNSRWFWWAGLGAGYFWTEDYVDDDEGAEVLGEAGIGYVISRNLKLRAGVNVIGMDTSVGRKNIADLGKDRFLWVIAPLVELEFTF